MIGDPDEFLLLLGDKMEPVFFMSVFTMAVTGFVADAAEGIFATEAAAELPILSAGALPVKMCWKDATMNKKARNTITHGADATRPLCHVLSLYSEENM